VTVRIQCFSFCLRGEATGQALSEDEAEVASSFWLNGKEAREDAAPRRGKRGNNASWANVNLIGPKNEKNTHGRFSWYKWMVKI
jgi:hypothetical protein